MNLKGILNFIDSKISIGFDVKPLEAINYFKNKGLKTTFSYADMLPADHVNNFTIAKMMDMDLLQDMQDSLLQAQKKGWTLQQWKDRMIPHLQANGWWGRQEVKDPITGKTIVSQLGSSRRLDVIFRTNMQQAYMAGQWQQIKEQERIAPYLMYNAVDDYRTREEHRAWDNKIYPVSHPFWFAHTPPNGWNCRCGIIQFSKSDLEDLGYEVSEDLKEEYREWKNPRTGLIEKIPKGVDGGFNVNAGQARFEQLQKIAKEKAHAIKDKALREAAEEALVKIEMKRIVSPAPVSSKADIILLKSPMDAAVTERIVKELIADSNKQYRLAEANARTILTLAPEGYIPKIVAGAGVEGADLIFENAKGDVFKIENKSTISFESFKDHLSHAAKKQATGSLVFFQVPDGTDVSNWLARFWGYRQHLIDSHNPRHMQTMNAYKTTKIVIYSASGGLLLGSQFIYQSKR